MDEHPFDGLPGLDLPMPDFDSEPAPAAPPVARARGTCSVHVRSFRDPVAAIEPVARLLAIDESTAAMRVAGAPFVIREGTDPADAAALVETLVALGAVAYVEDMATAARSPSMAPAAGLSSAPPSHPSAPPRPSAVEQAEAGFEDDRGHFWREAPIAFLAPFLGRGALLLLAAGAAGGFTGLVSNAPGIFALALTFALLVASLGILTETFGKLAQAAAGREPGEAPSPDFGLPDFSTLFFGGLVTLVAAGLLAGVPFVVYRSTQSTDLTLASALLPYVYWPMALTVQGISGRVSGLFDLVSVLRGIFAAPLEYLVVAVTSFGLVAAVPVAVGVSLIAVADSDLIALFTVIVGFVAFASLAYLHGVIGYLMGALIRSKPSKFAFMLQ